MSWMQYLLCGCLRGGLKRIKDSDESEVGHFPSLISSGSSVVILTVSWGRSAFACAAFLHFRLHLSSLQKTPFTTLLLAHFTPSSLYHSFITIHLDHNPETYFRIEHLTSRSYITFALTASLFSTPKLPLQETVIHVHYSAMPHSLESFLRRISDARWDIRENTCHMDHYMNGMLMHAKDEIEQPTVVANHFERFSRRTVEEWDVIPKIFMDDSSHGKVSNEIILC